MIVDMVSDVLQIKTYWEGEYVDDDDERNLPLYYFILSAAAWFLPPLVYIFAILFFLRGRGIFEVQIQKHFAEGLPKSPCKQFFFVLAIPVFLSMDILKASFMVYVYIPFKDISLGVAELIWGTIDMESQAISGLKLFEQLGNAVPQFCIALTFYIRHKTWIDENNQLFGKLYPPKSISENPINLSQTLLSISLSLGSITLGLIKGFNKWSTTRAMLEQNSDKLDALTLPRKVLESQYLSRLSNNSANLARGTRVQINHLKRTLNK